jgi:flavin-dependent dehydrogenase
MTVDLVIVGGGPVGLAAALYAVRAGVEPVVLERAGEAVDGAVDGALDKACGEGLMPGGVAALSALGVDPPGRSLRGIRYVGANRSAQADFRQGPGRGVRRTVLHAALRAAVSDAGIEVLPLEAHAVEQDLLQVTVRTRTTDRQPGPDLAAHWVFGADGLHSATRAMLGLTVASRGPRRWGQRRHYEVAPWSDHVEVHWGPIGEAYVTPVSEGMVGVAVLSERRAGFEEQLGQFPGLAERVRAGRAATPVRGAGPLRQRSARRVAGRVLLIGDASGYVDSLTGEGISLGLAHARAAVSAVRAGQPRRYELAWRQASWRYAVLTHALVRGTRPRWARGVIVPAASALPAVFARAVNELARSR